MRSSQQLVLRCLPCRSPFTYQYKRRILESELFNVSISLCQLRPMFPYRDQRYMLHRHAHKGRAWHICNPHCRPPALEALERVVGGMSHRKPGSVRSTEKRRANRFFSELPVAGRDCLLKEMAEEQDALQRFFLSSSRPRSKQDQDSFDSKSRVCVLAWLSGAKSGADLTQPQGGDRFFRASEWLVSLQGPKCTDAN